MGSKMPGGSKIKGIIQACREDTTREYREDTTKECREDTTRECREGTIKVDTIKVCKGEWEVEWEEVWGSEVWASWVLWEAWADKDKATTQACREATASNPTAEAWVPS